MTSSERRALLFLSAVALAGGGMRIAREWATPPAPGDTRRALARQIEAVDSAKRAETRTTGGGRGSRNSGARRASSADGRKTTPDLGLQAPRTGESGPSSFVPRPASLVTPSPLIDVDAATASELERLPRIGPALARRITRDRDSLGPFGSLGALQRVKGIGPALANGIASHVTFSGVPRPVNAVLGPASGAGTPATQAPRRRKKS